MFTFNGIGTRFYGSTDHSLDGSYVCTKWFVFCYFPIFPLGSYRVKMKDSSNLLVYESAEYETIRIPLHKKQVLKTYLFVPAIIIGIIVVFGMIGLLIEVLLK